jgi:hypothetical protein
MKKLSKKKRRNLDKLKYSHEILGENGNISSENTGLSSIMNRRDRMMGATQYN